MKIGAFKVDEISEGTTNKIWHGIVARLTKKQGLYKSYHFIFFCNTCMHCYNVK